MLHVEELKKWHNYIIHLCFIAGFFVINLDSSSEIAANSLQLMT